MTPRWYMLLVAGALLAACRDPQDPSKAPFGGPDGGASPPPEVQPDTGNPIGPVAAQQAGSITSPTVGGSAGSGGAGGVAGTAAMGGGSERPVLGLLLPQR